MAEEFRKRGERFDDADVARCYAFRPPYPSELLQTVLERVPGRSRLLDLGTGNGKIAGALASYFTQVTAVDPSQPMLDVASRMWDAQNIKWICKTTEDVPLTGSYDLVTAGASIHWMKPEIVFPKLAHHLSPQGAIAIIVGDFAHDPPWREPWNAFVERWTLRLGDAYEPEKWNSNYEAHEPWMAVKMREPFLHTFSQSVDDFIACQHSRASWARHKLGADNAKAFDTELKTLLAPFAREGFLTYKVLTNLTLGRPRPAPVMR